MSGPARSAAHWRSTEEHIMLPTAAPSLFILLFFSFSSSYFFFSCFCFLYKISSKAVWWARTLCFWVECLTPGSLTVTRTRCSPVASFFSAFIFALRLFLKTHKLTLHICCILLLLFFPLSLPLFLLKLLAFIPCGNAAKTIKSSTRPSCLQYVWTAREKKLLIINSRINQLSQCQSHCVREQSELFAEDQQLFRFCRLCTTEAGFHEERRYEISY